MKKTVILLLLFISFKSYSQDIFGGKNLAISPQLGLFFPYSSGTLNTSFNIGVDVEYKLNPVYAFADLVYNSTSRKNVDNISGSSILEFNAGPRVYFPSSKFNYFAEVGIGIYYITKGEYKETVNGITTQYPSVSSASPGINFGAGLETYLTKDLNLKVKGRYHLYFGKGDEPIINTYFGIYAGVCYRLNI